MAGELARRLEILVVSIEYVFILKLYHCNEYIYLKWIYNIYPFFSRIFWKYATIWHDLLDISFFMLASYLSYIFYTPEDIWFISLPTTVIIHVCHRSLCMFQFCSYRLAPEHPFPAAFDDCVTATKHLLENAAKYNVNANRVVIGGTLMLFFPHISCMFAWKCYMWKCECELWCHLLHVETKSVYIEVYYFFC